MSDSHRSNEVSLKIPVPHTISSLPDNKIFCHFLFFIIVNKLNNWNDSLLQILHFIDIYQKYLETVL